MRLLLCVLATVLLHVAGLVGLVHASLRTQLPDLYIRGTICILGFSPLNSGDLLLGGSEAEVRAFFGQPPKPTVGRPSGSRKCLRYRYAGSDVLTLLLERGFVIRTWVTSSPLTPGQCAGLVEQEVLVSVPSPWVASY